MVLYLFFLNFWKLYVEIRTAWCSVLSCFISHHEVPKYYKIGRNKFFEQPVYANFNLLWTNPQKFQWNIETKIEQN